MLEGGKISNRQLMFMLMFTVLGTAYFFLPALSALFAGRDLWLCPVFSTLPGLLVILVIAKLHSLYPGLSIIQYSEKILGKFVGKFAGLLFIFWFTHTNAIVIQEFGDFMNIAFMPTTPTIIFTGVITAVCGLAVYYGVELIARAGEFLFPMFLIFILSLLALAAGNIQIGMITPVLSKGLIPVLAGSLPPSGWRGEVVVAAMLLPFVNKPQKARNAGIYAVLLIGLLLVADSLEVAGVYGDETKRLVFPVLSLAREINILNFFQRLEVVLLVAWIAGLFVKVSVFYYCSVLAAAQWSGLASYRPVIVPLGVVLVALGSLNFGNVMDLVGFIALVWPFYGMTFGLLLPALLLAVALLFRKPG